MFNQIIKPMKKIYLVLTVLCLLCGYLPAQNLILVNGGQFGNPQENVNVQIYDPNTKTIRAIDTIHTNSVQEILIDGSFAFVAAQDSIVKYDLTTELRVASAGFNGFSTKAMAVYQNYLLVGNWYGKSSYNLYVYDRNNLALLDSVQQVTKGVSSILVLGPTALVSQNSTTANFEDTLGYITAINLDSLQQVMHIVPTNYSGDFGQLVATDNSLLTINSVSNTILEFQNLPDTTPIVHQFQQDISVTNPYQYSLYGDTLFLKWNGKLGSVEINTFNILDTTVIDTMVTAFALDTVRKQFYITQTDFFSYKKGGIYNYSGIKIDTLPVGFSPEVASMYYYTITSLDEMAKSGFNFKTYPNPVSDILSIEMESGNNPIELKIIDLTGKVVRQAQLKGQKSYLDLSELSTGIYVIQIQSEGKVSSSKLIKR